MVKERQFEYEELEAQVHRVEGSVVDDNKGEYKPMPTLLHNYGNRQGTLEVR